MPLFLVRLISAWSNLKTLAPLVPWWLLVAGALVICAPLSYFVKAKWRAKFSGLGTARKIFVLGAIPAAALAGVYGAALFVNSRMAPRVYDPIAGQSDPGRPVISNCDGRLSSYEEARDIRLDLERGRCEVELPDLIVQPGPHAHAFGVVFFQVPASLSLPLIGFNIHTAAQQLHRVRAHLYRLTPGSREWCLTATSTDSAAPQIERSLPKTIGWSSNLDDCWTEDFGVTSVRLRVEFNGMRFRVQAEFFKDAYSRAGRRADPSKIAHKIHAEYDLWVPETTEIVAGIGSSDQDQPVWHIWIVSDFWRRMIFRDE